MHFNQDDINTGERLRGIRESMKMNREEFSEKIDITDSFLGQIERGERDFIYHIVMYSNDFCKKLNKEQKIDKI